MMTTTTMRMIWRWRMLYERLHSCAWPCAKIRIVHTRCSIAGIVLDHHNYSKASNQARHDKEYDSQCGYVGTEATIVCFFFLRLVLIELEEE